MEKTDSPANQFASDPTETEVVDRFDWSETPPSVAVVRVLSSVLGVEPTGYQPLADSVDPTALDDLLRAPDREVDVSFTHVGVPVVAHADGTVIAYPD